MDCLFCKIANGEIPSNKVYEDEKILEFASCAAAANLSEADSIGGMKPKKELEKMHTIYERQTI